MSKLKFLLKAYKSKDLKHWMIASFPMLVLIGISFYFSGSTSSNNLSKKELCNIRQPYIALKKRLQQMEKFLIEVKEKDRMIHHSLFISKAMRSKSNNTSPRLYWAYNDKQALKQLEEKVPLLNQRIRQASRLLDHVMKSAKRNDVQYIRIPAIQTIPKNDAKNIASGFGNILHIDHQNSYTTSYGHLQTL